MDRNKQPKLKDRLVAFLKEKRDALDNYDRFIINNSQIPGRLTRLTIEEYFGGRK